MTSETPTDVTGVLSAVPYFAELDMPTLAATTQIAVRRAFEAGQVVLLEGESGSGLYVVEEGWLKTVKASSEGREQTVRLIGPGEFFNAIGVFVGAPLPVTVSALEPSVVWIIPHDALFHLLQTQPTLAQTIIRDLADRVLHLVSLVEDISLRTVEARLARYLLQHAAEERVQRKRWATQAEIAAQLGTVPDVLSRALHNLVAAGLVQVKRQEIRILDREGLQARTECTA